MKKLARRKNKRQKEQDNVKRTEINTLKKKSRFPIKRKQGVLKNFERFLQNLNNNQTTTGTHDSKISSVVFSSSKHKEIKVIFVFIPYFIGLLSKKVLPKLGDSEKRYKIWASHVEGFSKEGRLKPSSHYIHWQNIKISCLRN